MPATIESLTAKVRSLAVEIVPGDPESVITVQYSPLRYTRRVMRQHKAMLDEGDDIGLIFAVFQGCVQSWDFRPAAGADVIPLTDEALDDVDTAIIAAIVVAIKDDQDPKAAITT